ncbi:MAG: hypothetical protein WAM14_09410, partial [Candidatus Nitrosopolaris sp.]
VEPSSNIDGFETVSLCSSEVRMGDDDNDETDDLCSSEVRMGDGDDDDDQTDDLAIAGGIDAIDCVVIFSEF